MFQAARQQTARSKSHRRDDNHPPVSLESNALINDSNLIYHYSQVEEPSGIIYSVSYTLLPPILSSVFDPPTPPADSDTRTNHPFFLSPFFN